MKKFVIPSGFHISHFLPGLYRAKTLLNFDFMFTSSCKYDLGYEHNLDVNKLFGRSFGLVHNTTTIWGRLFKKSANSFRIGWNCCSQNGKIQLFAYYYNDGVRKIEYIAEVDVNKNYNCYIYMDRTANKIRVNLTSDKFESSTVYDFRFKDCPQWGLKLFPYFGGTYWAPQRMTIYIKEN